MEPMGLSRLHKRLFLLIDGQRTIAEIARLVGKKPEEIQEYIGDLINADFVRL
jgi:predicted transcriptional regulator